MTTTPYTITPDNKTMMTPVDPSRTTLTLPTPCTVFALLQSDKKVIVPQAFHGSLSNYFWEQGFRRTPSGWVRDADVSEDGVEVKILAFGDTLRWCTAGDEQRFAVLAVTRGLGKARVFKIGKAYDATLPDAKVKGVKVLQIPIEIPAVALGGAYALIIAPFGVTGGQGAGAERRGFAPDCDLVALNLPDQSFQPVNVRGQLTDNPIAIKNIAQGWANKDGGIYLKFDEAVPYLPRTSKVRGNVPNPPSDPDGQWWHRHFNPAFLSRNEGAMVAAKLMLFPRTTEPTK